MLSKSVEHKGLGQFNRGTDWGLNKSNNLMPPQENYYLTIEKLFRVL